MSIVLGIFDGTHDSGACIIDNGVLIAACDTERFTRQKGVVVSQHKPFRPA